MKEVPEFPEELKKKNRKYVLSVASRTPNAEYNFFSFNLILFNNPVLQEARTSLSFTETNSVIQDRG